MKVAVTGSTGQLGGDIVDVLTQRGDVEVAALAHEDVELRDLESVKAALSKHKPDAVINSAAFHQVDACENDPKSAFEVNAVGAWNVARACAEAGAWCIYISTDYVFDGAKGAPYTEQDLPRPLNVYGVSKLAGEHLTLAASPDFAVARVASVFGKRGARGKGGNFIEAILKKAKASENLTVVNDTPMTPTYTMDAAKALTQLVQKRPSGLVHVTNRGACSWFDFAKKAVELCGLAVQVAPVPSSTYPSKVKRPTYSALAGERLDAMLAKPMRAWPEALKDYLIEKGHIAG